MFGKIKNIVGGKEKPEDSDSKFDDFTPLANPNFLTDAIKISKLLTDIEEASCLCTINFEGEPEEFSSSILDVQPENGHIIVDELIPKQGNERLLNKKELKLSTIFKGIRLSFKLSRIKASEFQGVAYYKAAIPERIYYPQRRLSPRIKISTFNIPFSGISERTKSTLSGYIFDLSRAGIAIISNHNKAKIQRGETMSHCRITLDNVTINFDLIIRFVKASQQGSGKALIGGYFENMPSKKLNTLDHFIASLEREEIRKRKR